MQFFALMLMWGLVLLPAAAQQLPPVTDDNHLIVPGERIGPARLGDRVAKVIAVLGPPDVYDIAPGGVEEFLWALGPKPAPGTPRESWQYLDVNAAAEKIVRVILNGDPRYATATGVHVGSTDQEVQDGLGAPTQVATAEHRHALLYHSGIVFITSDGQGDSSFRVTAIFVISPRCFESTPPRDVCTFIAEYHDGRGASHL